MPSSTMTIRKTFTDQQRHLQRSLFSAHPLYTWCNSERSHRPLCSPGTKSSVILQKTEEQRKVPCPSATTQGSKASTAECSSDNVSKLKCMVSSGWASHLGLLCGCSRRESHLRSPFLVGHSKTHHSLSKGRTA